MKTPTESSGTNRRRQTDGISSLALSMLSACLHSTPSFRPIGLGRRRKQKRKKTGLIEKEERWICPSSSFFFPANLGTFFGSHGSSSITDRAPPLGSHTKKDSFQGNGRGEGNFCSFPSRVVQPEKRGEEEEEALFCVVATSDRERRKKRRRRRSKGKKNYFPLSLCSLPTYVGAGIAHEIIRKLELLAPPTPQ